ncbi:hypothetical protein PP707_05050 [Acetobacter pasteurianus]|nr:hypothetical protein [Acetobacter pasteurianus]
MDNANALFIAFEEKIHVFFYSNEVVFFHCFYFCIRGENIEMNKEEGT